MLTTNPTPQASCSKPGSYETLLERRPGSLLGSGNGGGAAAQRGGSRERSVSASPSVGPAPRVRSFHGVNAHREAAAGRPAPVFCVTSVDALSI